MPFPRPAYIEANRTGLLAKLAEEASRRLAHCTLCPRACGVDRTAGERGICGGRAAAEVASWGPHLGEEPPLVGRHGSGTVLFAHCNLRCCFCQNATGFYFFKSKEFFLYKIF